MIVLYVEQDVYFTQQSCLAFKIEKLAWKFFNEILKKFAVRMKWVNGTMNGSRMTRTLAQAEGGRDGHNQMENSFPPKVGPAGVHVGNHGPDVAHDRGKDEDADEKVKGDKEVLNVLLGLGRLADRREGEGRPIEAVDVLCRQVRAPLRIHKAIRDGGIFRSCSREAREIVKTESMSLYQTCKVLIFS